MKSMRGEPLNSATLGWHGRDRRLAFRRIDERGGVPWLTASKLADIVLFAPQRREEGNEEALPTHVVTPEGEVMPVFGGTLAAEVGRRYGARVEMMQWNHGIFDDASISLITTDTVSEIGRLAEMTWTSAGFVRTSLSDPRAQDHPSRALASRPDAAPPAGRVPPTRHPCGRGAPGLH